MFHTARNSEETSDMYVKPLDRHNLMRPETVESLFYFWRITRNETYREWGWNIWENGFEKYSKVEHGYTSLEDVSDASGGSKRDKMETYWMSETLKYFYLLFDEDETLLPLDKVVFNTEGHPFPVFDLT